MPRPLVFSNQKLYIAYDNNYCIRELFWPTVGISNHLNGAPIRLGISTPQGFSWCDSPEWVHHLAYIPNTLIGSSTLIHPQLGIEISIQETIDPKQPTHIKKITLQKCPFDSITLFFTQELQISETNMAQTAFYNPGLDAMVIYKNQYAFAFGAFAKNRGLKGYSAGLKGYGWQGTAFDALDGHLENHPIEQGSVDSIFSIDIHRQETITYWMHCAHSIFELKKPTNPQEIFTNTEQHNQNEIDQLKWPQSISKDELELAKQNYLILKTQIDSAGGILAANDSSIMVSNSCHYSYVWPRDGALVALTLLKYNNHTAAESFLEFCLKVFNPNCPVLLQKYTSQGDVGASWHPWIINNQPIIPAQFDETALVIWTIWETFQKKPQHLKRFYEQLILPALEYLIKQQDQTTGLFGPCWDLWEERRGFHLYTQASLIKAFESAHNIAQALNQPDPRWKNAKENLIASIETHLWDKYHQTYCRSFNDTTPDASILSLILWDIFPTTDPKLKLTLDYLEKHLEIKSTIGGYARYTNDYYARKSEQYPGNPWIICTLWLAQAHLKLNIPQAKTKVQQALQWCKIYANPSNVLPEQLHPDTGEHLTVSPLTWSHAELLETLHLLSESTQ